MLMQRIDHNQESGTSCYHGLSVCIRCVLEALPLYDRLKADPASKKSEHVGTREWENKHRVPSRNLRNHRRPHYNSADLSPRVHIKQSIHDF